MTPERIQEVTRPLLTKYGGLCGNNLGLVAAQEVVDDLLDAEAALLAALAGQVTDDELAELLDTEAGS